MRPEKLFGRYARSPKGHRLRRTRLAQLLRTHRIRRHTADSVLAVLRTPALTVAPGTVAAAQRHIGLLLEQVRLLHRQRQECERRLATLLTRAELAAVPSAEGPRREHSDLEILLSLPGAGNLVVATLLAEAGEALTDRDYTTLRTRSGVAPVTRRSGKKLTVLMRYACNEYLRNACHHWAQGAIRWDPRSAQHYARLRAKGHRHGRALRGVADRLEAMLIAMLRTDTLYDPTRHEAPRVDRSLIPCAPCPKHSKTPLVSTWEVRWKIAGMTDTVTHRRRPSLSSLTRLPSSFPSRHSRSL